MTVRDRVSICAAGDRARTPTDAGFCTVGHPPGAWALTGRRGTRGCSVGRTSSASKALDVVARGRSVRRSGSRGRADGDRERRAADNRACSVVPPAKALAGLRGRRRVPDGTPHQVATRQCISVNLHPRKENETPPKRSAVSTERDTQSDAGAECMTRFVGRWGAVRGRHERNQDER